LRDFTIPSQGVVDNGDGTGTVASGEVTFLKGDVTPLQADEQSPTMYVATGVGVFAAVEGQDFEFVETKELI
jgi:gentisate 1,2-dioxygenase